MRKTHVMFFLVSITGVFTNNHGNYGSLWMVCVQKCVFCATCETPYDDISSITKEGYKGI